MLEYDPRDPSQQQTGIPFDLLRRVREEEPVTQLKSGSWFVTRQAEVIPVLKDVETFRTDLGPLSGVGGVEDLDEHELFLSEILEPRHGKLRRLYNSCFGPHRVGRLEPFVEETCRALLDGMLEHDPADLHGEYALQIPSRVMARAMGLPDEAAREVHGVVVRRHAHAAVGVARDRRGRRAHPALLHDALAERRAMSDPPDDVTTFLLASEIDGEPLTDQEIATQLQFMVMAGVHTTRTLLTHLVHRLLEFPDVFAAVQQDRELVAPLIEESLRHDSPGARDLAPAHHRHRGRRLPDAQGRVDRGGGDVGQPRRRRLPRRRRVPARPSRRAAITSGSAPARTCARARPWPGSKPAPRSTCCSTASRAMRPVDGAEYPPLPSMLDHRPIPAHLVPAGS